MHEAFTTATDGTEEVLRLEGLRKYFASSGVLAVAGVTLSVRRGEVLALIGENGTGKTTLMNLLFGVHHLDAGRILVNGRPVQVRTPQDAIDAGVGMVHQHFALVPSFTVAQNVLLGREPTRAGRTDDRAAERRVAELAADLGFTIDPTARVSELSIGMQQRVEILKAMAGNARVLILDEPTAVLTPSEVDELLRMVRRLAAAGTSVVFISHKLPEVQQVADRIVVMRRGRVVGEVARGEAADADLAHLMVGREVLLGMRRAGGAPGEALLEMEDVRCAPSSTGDGGLDSVRLQVRAGEVVGVAGVSGNGQGDLVNAIAALRRVDAGRITVAGHDVTNTTPRTARRAGVAHIAEDRMHQGLNLYGTVEANLVATRYRDRRFSRRGVFRRGAVRRFAQEVIDDYHVRGAAPSRAVGSLSGGNLQKIVIGRELDGDPAVLLANQPTRGLDVGSIDFVHRSIAAARERGAGVLLVSAELEEVLSLSDRVAVMYRGRLFGPYPHDEMDRDRIGRLMAGSVDKEEE